MHFAWTKLSCASPRCVIVLINTLLNTINCKARKNIQRGKQTKILMIYQCVLGVLLKMFVQTKHVVSEFSKATILISYMQYYFKLVLSLDYLWNVGSNHLALSYLSTRLGKY